MMSSPRHLLAWRAAVGPIRHCRHKVNCINSGIGCKHRGDLFLLDVVGVSGGIVGVSCWVDDVACGGMHLFYLRVMRLRRRKH